MQPSNDDFGKTLCLPKLVPCYDLRDVMANIFLLLPPPPEGSTVQGARIARDALASAGTRQLEASSVDPNVQVPQDPNPLYSVLGQGYNIFEGASHGA